MDVSNNNDIARHIIIAVNAFCSGVVHELRSPLQAVENSIMLMEHVLEESDDEVAAMAIKNIINSVESINTILTSMTTMGNNSNYADEHDAMKIILKDRKLSDLTGTIQEAVEVFQLTTTHKECQATIQTSLPKELIHEHSAFAVKQVLINLLSNSSKSCRKAHGIGKGNICISLDNNENGLYIKVTDSGVGVSNDVAEKIFLPLFRADTSIPGKGIGLHLSRLWAYYAGMQLELLDGEPGNTTFCLIMKNHEVC